MEGGMWGVVSKAGFTADLSSWLLGSANTSFPSPLRQSALSTSPVRATVQPQIPHDHRAHGLLLSRKTALVFFF